MMSIDSKKGYLDGAVFHVFSVAIIGVFVFILHLNQKNSRTYLIRRLNL